MFDHPVNPPPECCTVHVYAKLGMRYRSIVTIIVTRDKICIIISDSNQKKGRTICLSHADPKVRYTCCTWFLVLV